MREVVIVSAARTAIGSFNGSLTPFSAVELGSMVIKEAIARAGVEKESIDEVIFGNVLQAGLGQKPARQAAIKAGIPMEVPSFTVNKVCGSGLKTVNLAAEAIMAGSAEIVVAGGMESMTNAPYVLDAKARQGYRMGHAQVTDVMIQDGLWCAFNDYHMGITAEKVATKWGVSRQDQDEFAYRSHQKAVAAIDGGEFTEIRPVTVTHRLPDPHSGQIREIRQVVDTDEGPRRDTTPEALAGLRTVFDARGSVTAASSSQMSDGAGALIMVSERVLKELNLQPLAVFRGFSVAGVPAEIMGIGPIEAIPKVLKQTGIAKDDLDWIELNEAFAAQALAVIRTVELDPTKVNPLGGAIALGHPLGATGAILAARLIHGLQRRQQRYGMVTMCIGTGMGAAGVFERL